MQRWTLQDGAVNSRLGHIVHFNIRAALARQSVHRRRLNWQREEEVQSQALGTIHSTRGLVH